MGTFTLKDGNAVLGRSLDFYKYNGNAFFYFKPTFIQTTVCPAYLLVRKSEFKK
uniref:Uncharacterized protein n=1 Tax=Anguilla anguilla TaxID=7936 RepID=A0A0E9XVH9_ANGAN